MSLGTMLKEARKRAGLTQEAAANQLYVSRQTLSKWETDLSEPKASELLHCLELYHLPVTALLELRPDLSAADVPAQEREQRADPIQALSSPKARKPRTARSRSRKAPDPMRYAPAAACFAVLLLSAALFSGGFLPRPVAPDAVSTAPPALSESAFLTQVERQLGSAFGGLYYEDGKLIVNVTCPPATVVLPAVSDGVQVELRQVQYAYAAMKAVQDYIEDYMIDAGPECGLRGVGIRVAENRLVVQYGTDTGYDPSRLMWLLEQKFGDVPFVQFEETDGMLVTAV